MKKTKIHTVRITRNYSAEVTWSREDFDSEKEWNAFCKKVNKIDPEKVNKFFEEYCSYSDILPNGDCKVEFES